MPFLLEKLQVCQKAVDFADGISELTSNFPRGCFYLADPSNRAALSIPTHIAEDNGLFTAADRRHFFGIARGSDHECVPVIEICRRRELVTEEQATSLRSDPDQIGRMLSGLINGLENRNIG